ncbi:MAG: hypothetical protein R3E97_23465 [Candidatus Eisenbacteria bacterium]
MKKLVCTTLLTLAGTAAIAPFAFATPNIALDLNPAYPEHVENPGGQMTAWCVVEPDGTNPDALRIVVEDPTGAAYAEWVYPGVTEWTLQWTVPEGVVDGIWNYHVEYYSEEGLAASADQAFIVAGRTSGICAFKFYDANGNGILDDGEELLSNWEICLNGPEGTECDFTDEDGVTCWFFLTPGTYEVCEVMQEGWTNTTDLCVEIPISNSIEKAMFGNMPVVPVERKSWGGIKSVYR